MLKALFASKCHLVAIMNRSASAGNVECDLEKILHELYARLATDNLRNAEQVGSNVMLGEYSGQLRMRERIVTASWGSTRMQVITCSMTFCIAKSIVMQPTSGVLSDYVKNQSKRKNYQYC